MSKESARSKIRHDYVNLYEDDYLQLTTAMETFRIININSIIEVVN